MSWHRVVLAGFLVAACVLVLGPPASAWEISLNGAFQTEMDVVGQSGTNGFFGTYDFDAGVGAPGAFAAPVAGTYASYNFFAPWPGFRVVSGSDSSWLAQYMTVNLQLRMNQALRLRGTYYVGSWNPGIAPNQSTAAVGNLPASFYYNSGFGGIQQSFSPGYWNTLYLSAELPWGILAIGKRPSIWGTGLGWNGVFSRSSEKLALVAPYGPFRIGLGIEPARRAFVASGITPAKNSTPSAPTATTTVPVAPAAITASVADYFNPDFDKNNTRIFEWGPNITYRQGPIDMGILFNWMTQHRGGEGIILPPTGAVSKLTRAYRDRDELYGGVYFKYYVGRFYFNAEMDWFTQTNRNRRRTAAGLPDYFATTAASPFSGRGNTDSYIEHWRWMAEASFVSGPAKLSVLYAWFSGGDRRLGFQIDRNGIVDSDAFSNTGLFRPYSYLMVYSYGLGHFIDSTSGYGYAEDASIYAARADYSIAANLNIYGSFFWADRATRSGFGWGCIQPRIWGYTGATAVTVPVVSPDGTVDPPFGDGSVNMGFGRNGAPNIPDTNLGYEIDAGFAWKLLEGLSFNATFAYWVPGKWWKYACVDKAIPGWGLIAAVPLGAATNLPATWAVNPNRAIDSVWGMQFVLTGDF